MGFSHQSWADNYVRQMDQSVDHCLDKAMYIDRAISAFTTRLKIKNYMDASSSLIGNFFEAVFGRHDSLRIGTEEQSPLVTSIVVGCTLGVIRKTIGLMGDEEALDLSARLIIYRYAVRNYIDNPSEANAIVDKHALGFSEEYLPIRVSALKYVTSGFDERYLDFDLSHEVDEYETQQTENQASDQDHQEPESQPQPDADQKEYDENAFAECLELVAMQMDITLQSVEAYINLENPASSREFLAFELGVIEYFAAAFLNAGVTDDDIASCRIFNFMIYYTKERYKERSREVSSFMEGAVDNKSFLHERELGFNSVNNATINRAHFPGNYLLKALKVRI